MRLWVRIVLGALAGPVVFAVLLSPIEIVYRLGGTYTQAMLATSALLISIAGATFAAAFSQPK